MAEKERLAYRVQLPKTAEIDQMIEEVDLDTLDYDAVIIASGSERLKWRASRRLYPSPRAPHMKTGGE